MSSINLVAVSLGRLEKKQKHIRIARILAIVSLVLVSSLALIVFLLNVVTLPFSAIEKDTKDTLANLSSLHGKLVKYSFANDRISNIQTTLAKRKDFVTPLNSILSKLPKDLTIENLDVEKKSVSLTLSGKSLNDMNQVIYLLVNLGNQGKIIAQASIDSLILDPATGVYTLTIKAGIR